MKLTENRCNTKNADVVRMVQLTASEQRKELMGNEMKHHTHAQKACYGM
jgi:hypothetical protein